MPLAALREEARRSGTAADDAARSGNDTARQQPLAHVPFVEHAAPEVPYGPGAFLPLAPPAEQPHGRPPLAALPFAGPWHYEVHFPRDPRGPRLARVALRAVLASHGLGELVERAELPASELTTNTVRHTAGPGSVRLGWTQPALHVSVWDTEPALPARSGPDAFVLTDPAPPHDAIGGRGLLLLNVLADHWGSCALDDGPWGPGGKTVWFELLLKGDRTPPVLAA